MPTVYHSLTLLFSRALWRLSGVKGTGCGQWYTEGMILETAYFPLLSGGIVLTVLLILAWGWHAGFLRRLIGLAAWAASVLSGWWIASTFRGISVSYLTSLSEVQQMLISRIVLFFIVTVLIRILVGVLLGFTGLLRKITVFRLADRVGGLILSAVISWIVVSLLTLFLQTGVIENGPLYVESSGLHVVADLNDQLLAAAMKGELNIDEIRSALSQGTR